MIGKVRQVFQYMEELFFPFMDCTFPSRSEKGTFQAKDVQHQVVPKVSIVKGTKVS